MGGSAWFLPRPLPSVAFGLILTGPAFLQIGCIGELYRRPLRKRSRIRADRGLGSEKNDSVFVLPLRPPEIAAGWKWLSTAFQR